MALSSKAANSASVRGRVTCGAGHSINGNAPDHQRAEPDKGLAKSACVKQSSRHGRRRCKGRQCSEQPHGHGVRAARPLVARGTTQELLVGTKPMRGQLPRHNGLGFGHCRSFTRHDDLCTQRQNCLSLIKDRRGVTDGQGQLTPLRGATLFCGVDAKGQTPLWHTAGWSVRHLSLHEQTSAKRRQRSCAGWRAPAWLPFQVGERAGGTNGTCCRPGSGNWRARRL